MENKRCRQDLSETLSSIWKHKIKRPVDEEVKTITLGIGKYSTIDWCFNHYGLGLTSTNP